MPEKRTPGKGLRLSGKQARGSPSACGKPVSEMMVRVPKRRVKIGGRKVLALIDSGCTTSMVETHLVSSWREGGRVTAFDGRTVECCGMSAVKLEIDGHQLNVEVVVANRLVPGVEVIIGMDVICALGGVIIDDNGARFLVDEQEERSKKGSALGAVAQKATENLTESDCETVGENNERADREMGEKVIIEDQDFRAEFDGEEWTVEWVWKENPPELKNKVAV